MPGERTNKLPARGEAFLKLRKGSTEMQGNTGQIKCEQLRISRIETLPGNNLNFFSYTLPFRPQQSSTRLRS